MWPCRSVIVGMTVLPLRSTRVAPAGTNTSARRPAAMKRVPSTTNAAFSMTSPSPVISRAPSYTVTSVWACAAECPITMTNAADSSTRLVRIIAASLAFIHRRESDFDLPNAHLSPQRAAHALRGERQLAQPHTGERCDGVADRAGDERQPVLAGSGRRIVG